MVAVIEANWQDIIDGNPLPESPARRIFKKTVESVSDQAKDALPEANGRVERARDLLLAGSVFRNEEDDSFTVRSQNGKKSYKVNGDCSCADYQRGNKCQHLISTWIWRKARKIIAEEQETLSEQTVESSQPIISTPLLTPERPEALAETPGTTNILPQFITQIHGKDFVQFAGLLHMAHERGLRHGHVESINLLNRQYKFNRIEDRR
jgi:hypothetical protein